MCPRVCLICGRPFGHIEVLHARGHVHLCAPVCPPYMCSCVPSLCAPACPPYVLPRVLPMCSCVPSLCAPVCPPYVLPHALPMCSRMPSLCAPSCPPYVLLRALPMCSCMPSLCVPACPSYVHPRALPMCTHEPLPFPIIIMQYGVTPCPDGLSSKYALGLIESDVEICGRDV